jgi:hypothetical protein
MDLKALGYFVSAISVFFLGMVAWPGPGEPAWQAWAVGIGMATSVGGMFVRYLSHRKDRHDIHRTEREALSGTAEKEQVAARPGDEALRHG